MTFNICRKTMLYQVRAAPPLVHPGYCLIRHGSSIPEERRPVTAFGFTATLSGTGNKNFGALIRRSSRRPPEILLRARIKKKIDAVTVERDAD